VNRQLQRDDRATRSEKLARLSAAMREWTSRPPDHDDAWWDDFERELRENRLTFGAMGRTHHPAVEA